jgi:hypothetical protein
MTLSKSVQVVGLAVSLLLASVIAEAQVPGAASYTESDIHFLRGQVASQRRLLEVQIHQFSVKRWGNEGTHLKEVDLIKNGENVLKAADEYDQYAIPLSKLDPTFKPAHYELVGALRRIPPNEFQEASLLAENYLLWSAGGGSAEAGARVADQIYAKMHSYLSFLDPHAEADGAAIQRVLRTAEYREQAHGLEQALKVATRTIDRAALQTLPLKTAELQIARQAVHVAELTRRYDAIASMMKSLDPSFVPVKIPAVEAVRLLPEEVIWKIQIQANRYAHFENRGTRRTMEGIVAELKSTLAPYIGSFLAIAVVVGPAIKAYEAFSPSEHHAPSAGSASQMNASVLIGNDASHKPRD